MRKIVIFLGMLLLLCGNAARAQESETEPSTKAPEYRLNMQIGAQVPIALANRVQREAFRGLVATDLMLNIYIAKNVYVGVGAQYNLFQTRGPNNFKLKNRDILQHHLAPGISVGYEARLKSNNRYSFYPNLFLGYSFVYFSGLGAGMTPGDSLFYAPVKATYLNGSMMISPQLSFLMYMDQGRSSLIGFTLGVNLLPYELKKTHIYLEKIVNGVPSSTDSYFYDMRDNGLTVYMKVGFFFMQKFKKIKYRIPIR